MRNIKYLILISIFFVFISCHKKSPTETPPVNNSHPQVNIPWPSLADSPWPMHHHDPQSTGRSVGVGPQLGTIVWKYDVGHEVGTSVAIGSDSTIYFGSNGPYLWALNWDGFLKWKLHLSDNSPQYTQACSPLISADGTIYIGTRGKLLYAVNPDGTKKWTFEADDWLNNLGMNIGLDGTIYFVDANFWLYAVNPDGFLEWKIGGDYKFQGIEMSGIAISTDGSMLYMGCLGTEESDTTTGLIAVGIDGVVKWLYNTFPAYGTPLVDNDGNIFYCARKSSNSNIPENTMKEGFFSITSEGVLRWYFNAKMGPMIDPVIDYFGNVYFVYGETSSTSGLLSFTNDGKFRWNYTNNEGVLANSSLLCDYEGKIYFASQSNYMLIFSIEGVLIRKLKIAEVIWNSPALAFSRLIFGSGFRDEGGKLYCLQ